MLLVNWIQYLFRYSFDAYRITVKYTKFESLHACLWSRELSDSGCKFDFGETVGDPSLQKENFLIDVYVTEILLYISLKSTKINKTKKTKQNNKVALKYKKYSIWISSSVNQSLKLINLYLKFIKRYVG